ncbi:MAG: hypothetical protein AB1491_00110 [Thermodesulfobacteriota bacterium]
MAKSTKAQPVDAFEKEWRRKVSFNFGKGGMQEPEGFKDLSVDQEVTVLVTGKVTSIRSETETSQFDLHMEKIELQTGKKPGTMGEALKNVMAKRRR